MAFIEEWQTRLEDSLAAFAQLATTTDDIDFTYGILATAVLWPIRHALQDYDPDAIAAVRQVGASKGKVVKLILDVVGDWKDDCSACARSLATQAQDKAELRLALSTLINYFDAAQAFAGHLARVLVQQQGSGDVYNITEQIKAALVTIGGVTNIKSLAITINIPYVEPRPKRGKRFWVSVAFLFVLIVSGVVWVWSILNRFSPMSEGFNVAVAKFTMVDENEHATVTDISEDFSLWLFERIENDVKLLTTSMVSKPRGPENIGPILGDDRDTRSTNATNVATKHNATILIYGVITANDNEHEIELEFYVADEAFGYGSESAGPSRLGQPVSFTLPLDRGESSDINEKLNARVKALLYLVKGLSKFYIEQYERAWADFKWAADIEQWRPEEGKEVVYLLMGAAKLYAYDPVTDPEQLSMALAAFQKARELNPDYARSYLGLGAVALEEAKIISGTKIVAVDGTKLIEAQGFYLTSLSASEQPPSAYVPAKADYGLGQIHLVGFGHQVIGWSRQEAWDAFSRVITTYEAAGEPPDLVWFAAGAHAQIGLLSGHNNDWQTMIKECREAISMLDDLPYSSARTQKWIARYWSWLAIAERKLCQTDNARHAYQQAIEIGADKVSTTELQDWKAKRDNLQEGAECDDSP